MFPHRDRSKMMANGDSKKRPVEDMLDDGSDEGDHVSDIKAKRARSDGDSISDANGADDGSEHKATEDTLDIDVNGKDNHGSPSSSSSSSSSSSDESDDEEARPRNGESTIEISAPVRSESPSSPHLDQNLDQNSENLGSPPRAASLELDAEEEDQEQQAPQEQPQSPNPFSSIQEGNDDDEVSENGEQPSSQPPESVEHMDLSDHEEQPRSQPSEMVEDIEASDNEQAPSEQNESVENIELSDNEEHAPSSRQDDGADADQIIVASSEPTPQPESIGPSQVESSQSSGPGLPLPNMSSVIAAAGTPLAQHQLKFCLTQIVKNLKRLKDATPFLKPVDPVALNIPDYPNIIKHPMDLSTVQTKLEKNEYPTVKEFIDDMELMFNNCYRYNGPGAPVTLMGESLHRSFRKWVEKLPTELKSKDKKKKIIKPSEVSKACEAQSTLKATASSNFQPPPERVRPKRDVSAPSRELAIIPTSPPKKKPAAKIQNPQLKFCAAVLRELKSKKHQDCNLPFLDPVDPIALNIPHYFDIIKDPMDLSTIQKKLDRGEYETASDFEHDVRLMFNNCYTFNPPGDGVYLMGQKLEKIFLDKWKERPKHAPPPPASSTKHDKSSKSAAGGSEHSKKSGVVDAGGAKSSSSKHRKSQQFLPMMPMVASQSSESESSSEEETATVENQQINVLQQQLALMTSHLAMLMESQTKKKKKHKSMPGLPMIPMIPGAPLMPMAAPSVPAVPSKSSSSKKSKSKSKSHHHHHHHHGTDSLTQGPASAASTWTSVPAAPSSSKSKSSSKKKKEKSSASKKKSRSASSDDEHRNRHHQHSHTSSTSSTGGAGASSNEGITMQQKMELSEKISMLTAEQLPKVFEIIQLSVGDVQGEEIELEIDTLDNATLYKLYQYVTSEVGGGGGAA
ncbi:hypothetical protein HK102_013016, partial [Quaeritorhiza haematococci]